MAGEPEGGPTKVLIADDSPFVLRMIEAMLVGAGLTVVKAKDGLEAIEKALTNDVSLVILDVMMPRMNGYQACRLLKTEPATKMLPIVILTSKDQAGDRFWGLETGADHYITKDAEPQRILELVRSILASDKGKHKVQVDGTQQTSVDVLTRVNELLDRKLYEATILGEIGRVARSLSQFDETFRSVMSLVSRAVDFTVGAMGFVEDDRVELVIVPHRAVSPSVIEEFKVGVLDSLLAERDGVRFSEINTRLFALTEASKGIEEAHLDGFAVYPIVTGGKPTGILGLGGKAAERVSPEQAAFLGQVANQAQIVIENSRLFERVRNLSIRDGLTAVFNRRHSMDILTNEYDRCARYEVGLSVLMLDIDHFKRINDRYHHQAGDVVIRDVARLLRESVRNADAVGRYGGEEFIAILPHTAGEGARQIAERIRELIQEHVFRFGEQEIRATVSIGIASAPNEKIASPQDLVREADRALYRAKESGRNRVVGA